MIYFWPSYVAEAYDVRDLICLRWRYVKSPKEEVRLEIVPIYRSSEFTKSPTEENSNRKRKGTKLENLCFCKYDGVLEDSLLGKISGHQQQISIQHFNHIYQTAL